MPVYQPHTLGYRIVRGTTRSIIYLSIWFALVLGAPALVFLILGR